MYKENIFPKGFTHDWHLAVIPPLYGLIVAVRMASFFVAHSYVSVTLITVLLTTTPAMSLVLARIFLGARITWYKVSKVGSFV